MWPIRTLSYWDDRAKLPPMITDSNQACFAEIATRGLQEVSYTGERRLSIAFDRRRNHGKNGGTFHNV